MSDEDLPVNQIRDFKGVWIPADLWACRFNPADLQAIVNAYYFENKLTLRVWNLLQGKEWAEEINGEWLFTPKFCAMFRGGR